MFSDKIDYFLNRDMVIRIHWAARAPVRLLWEWEIIERSERAFFRISVRRTGLIIAELKILRLTRLWLAIFQILPAAAYSDWLLGSCYGAASWWVMIPLLLLMLNNNTNWQQTKTIRLKFCSKFLTFLLVKPQKDS